MTLPRAACLTVAIVLLGCAAEPEPDASAPRLSVRTRAVARMVCELGFAERVAAASAVARGEACLAGHRAAPEAGPWLDPDPVPTDLDVEALFEWWKRLGAALGDTPEAKARARVRAVRIEIARGSRAVMGRVPLRAVWLTGLEPLTAVSGYPAPANLLEAAGAVHVLETRPGPRTRLTASELREARPELVLDATGRPAAVAALFAGSDPPPRIAAIPIDADTAWGPDALLGASRSLRAVVHPPDARPGS